MTDDTLIGRERELAEIETVLASARVGRGALLLVSGEAGVGKTRLANTALAESGLRIFRGVAIQEATSPYSPLVAALRSFLSNQPGGLDDCGPLSAHLALILPELGPRPESNDRPTLFEAINCAFAAIARAGPAAVLLDDLQWADNASLELLAALAPTLERLPILLLGIYRSDEMPRGHPVRRLRAELRRGRRLGELGVEPLDAAHTAALAERVAGRALGPEVAAMIHDRTQGVPFFIEELVQAVGENELVRPKDVPLPETVRDAVMVRAERLSLHAREALEVAAVAGLRFDLPIVVELANEDGLDEALQQGFVLEDEAGTGRFRHALTREAFYEAVTWTRRRSLHTGIAERLEAHDGAPAVIAEHWLAAQRPKRARPALLAASESYAEIHAHRDAARALRRAIDLWPPIEDEPERLCALVRLGAYAELSADLSGAARAWREAAAGYEESEDVLELAKTQRKLAALFELQCLWDAAFAARDRAAQAFSASSQTGEAAAERIAAAGNLQSAGSLRAALDLVIAARDEAEAAGRADLTARALGLEGLVRARLGDIETGLQSARTGLSLALSENLVAPAAEAYEKVGMIHDLAVNQRDAVDAFTTALDYCNAHGIPGRAKICLGCLAYVLRKTGEWDRVIKISREVTAADDAPRNARCAAIGEAGLVHALRGDLKRAAAPLTEASALAEQTEFMIMRLETTWGLARLDDQRADFEGAERRCRRLLDLAAATEDSHYPVPALRWATTFLASRGAEDEAGACAERLAAVSSGSANAEALAAIAHALGEMALLNDDAEQAARQFLHALELLRELELPLDRAETQLRAGVSLAAVGERETAVERLTDAYRTARKLGARPLAARARSELELLGEQVDRRRSRAVNGGLEEGGLSGREPGVVRLVAVGRTNREIASDLFLSPRTIDMHVRNILTKLDCRSRTDATRKAAELGLLA